MGIEDWYSNSIPSAEIQTLLPCLRQLTPREFDILKFKHRADIPEKHRRILRLNTSIHYSGTEAGTLTPSSRHYITDKCRLVTGTEMLCQQGIVYPCMNRLESSDQSFLADLAGNAFHAWVAGVVLLASVRVAALCHRAHPPTPWCDAPLLTEPIKDEAEQAEPAAEP